MAAHEHQSALTPVAAQPSLSARLLGLVRLPLQYVGLWLIPVMLALTALSVFASMDMPRPVLATVVVVVVGAVVVGAVVVGAVMLSAALTALTPVDRRDPLVVALPVRGMWQAVNSPATKVPSHGTHAYGHTFAIDLVRRPEGDARRCK